MACTTVAALGIVQTSAETMALTQQIREELVAAEVAFVTLVITAMIAVAVAAVAATALGRRGDSLGVSGPSCRY